MTAILDTLLSNRLKTLLALLLPALLLYGKSLGYGFSTLDEQWMILDNAFLKQGWWGLGYAWSHPMAASYYRPLLATSFYLDYFIGQVSPFVYHASNVLMHLGCVLLLFRFLQLNGLHRRTAFVLALLFSVHPSAVHAVAWVPGRNDLLLCLFTLASLNPLLLFLQQGKRRHLVWHFVFFVCALFTKESAVMLPLVFTCYQLLYKKEEAPFFLKLIGGWAIVSLAWFLLRNQIVSPSHLGMGEAFFKNVLPGLMLFMGKTLLPLKQSVLPTLENSSIRAGLISTVVILLLLWKPGLKNKGLAAQGGLIFLGLLALPVWFGATKSGGEFYEHRMYTSMVGLALVFSQLRFNWNTTAMSLMVLALFFFYFLRTWSRERVYRDDTAFIMAGAEEAPDFHLFPFQKSGLLFARRQYDSALVCIDQALARRQDKPQLYNNRGSIYFMLGRYPEAIQDYTKAIKLSPSFDFRPYLDRGYAYCRAGMADSAMRDLKLVKRCCQAQIPKHYEADIVRMWNEQHSDRTQRVQ